MNLTSDKAKEVVGRPKLVLVVASLRAVCFREEEKERNTVGRFSCNVDRPWRILHPKSDDTDTAPPRR